MLNGNIGITFQIYGLILYDNDASIKYAVHKAFMDHCRLIEFHIINRVLFIVLYYNKLFTNNKYMDVFVIIA